MIVVPIKEGENIEKALKKLKRKFEKTGVVKELRERQKFTKPSVLNQPEADDLNVDSAYLTKEQPSFNVGGTFVLKEIFFEFDKSTILQQSFFELMKLQTLLGMYPEMCVEIGGHTGECDCTMVYQVLEGKDTN